MKYGRTFNFSAGPAMMPEPVLEEIRDAMMNDRAGGLCVMEMRHSSNVFQQLISPGEAELRDPLWMPDAYQLLVLQSGACLQYAAGSLNLL